MSDDFRPLSEVLPSISVPEGRFSQAGVSTPDLAGATTAAGDCLSCRALERLNNELTAALRLLIEMDYIKPQGREIITALLHDLNAAPVPSNAVPPSPERRSEGEGPGVRP